MVKPYGKGSDLQCIREANEGATAPGWEDITAPRWPIGPPRLFALAGLFFLVLGLLLVYVGLSEKNEAIGGAWTLFGLLTSSWGVFCLLLALFWSENLRKYREKHARATSGSFLGGNKQPALSRQRPPVRLVQIGALLQLVKLPVRRIFRVVNRP